MEEAMTHEPTQNPAEAQSAAPLAPAVEPAEVASASPAPAPASAHALALERMMDAFGRAVAFGAPQLITILGAAGSGKTALLEAFRARIAADARAHRVLFARAAGHEPRGALVAALLRERFGLSDAAAPDAQAELLREQLSALVGDRRVSEVMSVLADLIGVAGQPGPIGRAIQADPGGRDEVVRAVVRYLIERDAEKGAVCLLLDSFEQADARSVALLGALSEGLAGAPVVIACAARPDLLVTYADWSALETEQTRVDLDLPVSDKIPPLSPDEGARARVAALAPAERSVLEKAAAVGNVFWSGALLALTRLHDRPTVTHPDPARKQLEAHLASLAERDYVLRMPDSSVPGDVEYCFRDPREHALLFEATPPNHAREHALCAAQWLEVHLTDFSEEQLELVGQLYEAGGNERRAAYLYLAAGDKARQRFAGAAALRDYEQGLALLGPDDGWTRLEVLHNLGDVRARLGQIDRALADFRAMLESAWLLDLRGKCGAAGIRIGRLRRQRGEYQQALEQFESAYAQFIDVGDKPGIAAALEDIGRVHAVRGELDPAVGFCRQALELRRGLGEPRGIAIALSTLGRCHYALGSFRAAFDCFDEAAGLRNETTCRQVGYHVLHDLAHVHIGLGDAPAAVRLLEEARTLAREMGDRWADADAERALALVRLGQNDAASAADGLHRGVDVAEALGDPSLLAECARGLGEALLELGDSEGAAEYARQSLELSERFGLRLASAAAWGLIARISAWSEQPHESTVSWFERAIAELSELGHDLLLAQVCSAYAEYRQRSGDVRGASSLAARSAEIGRRLLLAAQASATAIPISIDYEGRTAAV
jgi:tetratricopeptide (TPR) repeat protein